ncbi:conserved hypothetical protein [Ricinus communis]|uniref:non-specific serine/threonine protein kinase n=1 Tax=Ricinus communis TaxID=3988 RepID=B9RP60_RICCO|nr:conserved hypothetical protein [Ricinus communis]
MFMFLFLLIFLNEASPNQASLTSSSEQASFSFTSFDPESCKNGTLICFGSVNGGDGVLFHQPVIAWPAIITTTFTVRISTSPNSSNSGDGLAFIMEEDNRPSPPYSYGSYLGIMDKSTKDGVVRQIAVELDTYPNEFDPDGNHKGIDTRSITNPVTAKSLNDTGIDLKSGRDIKVPIDYNSWTTQLQVSVAYDGYAIMSFLNHSIDMSATVPQFVFVGFTASTGLYPESHQVLNWEFQSTPLLEIIKGYVKDRRTKTILITDIPIIGLMFVAVFTIPLARRCLRKKKEMINNKIDIESRTKIAANVPKVFSYKQLSKDANSTQKTYPPETVAFKRISATSKQDEREHLAEICTIGWLRNKNIVQLQGLASALLYLHEECGNHRDINPNNIMLDSDCNGHLGDFGLARLLHNNSSSVTTMLADTPGYLAPEVGYSGKATPESDVYSFGMIVIEVVSGRRSKGVFEENSLLNYFWSLHEKNALIEGVDKMLQGTCDEQEVKRALIVGLACLRPDPNFRPKIRKVEQIFLNQNEPSMELPESRPNAVYLPLLSSSTETTTDFGSKGIISLLQSSMSMEKPDEIVVHY